MKRNNAPPVDPRVRRQHAEAKQHERETAPRRTPPREPDPRALVHELEVHQIELEMQNDELQRAHEEVQQAAARYTELFDFAPIGYFVLDPLGLIREVNLAGAALVGLDRHRVAGQPFAQFVDPNDRARYTDFACHLQPGMGRRTCEVRLLQTAPEARFVLIQAALPEAQPGREDGYWLTVIDITDRKRAEQEARELSLNLEKRVVERTAELITRNDQLNRFHRATVGREMVMVELKQEINGLCAQLSLPPRYPGATGEEQSL